MTDSDAWRRDVAALPLNYSQEIGTVAQNDGLGGLALVVRTDDADARDQLLLLPHPHCTLYSITYPHNSARTINDNQRLAAHGIRIACYSTRRFWTSNYRL